MTDDNIDRLESLMDKKTKLACACCQLNDAIYALKQAQFSLAQNDITHHHRMKVRDIEDDLSVMVENLIDEQRKIREEFKRVAKEGKDEEDIGS